MNGDCELLQRASLALTLSGLDSKRPKRELVHQAKRSEAFLNASPQFFEHDAFGTQAKYVQWQQISLRRLIRKLRSKRLAAVVSETQFAAIAWRVAQLASEHRDLLVRGRRLAGRRVEVVLAAVSQGCL